MSSSSIVKDDQLMASPESADNFPAQARWTPGSVQNNEWCVEGTLISSDIWFRVDLRKAYNISGIMLRTSQYFQFYLNLVLLGL